MNPQEQILNIFSLKREIEKQALVVQAAQTEVMNPVWAAVLRIGFGIAGAAALYYTGLLFVVAVFDPTPSLAVMIVVGLTLAGMLLWLACTPMSHKEQAKLEKAELRAEALATKLDDLESLLVLQGTSQPDEVTLALTPAALEMVLS